MAKAFKIGDRVMIIHDNFNPFKSRPFVYVVAPEVRGTIRVSDNPQDKTGYAIHVDHVARI